MLRVPCFAHFVATTTYDVRVRGLVAGNDFDIVVMCCSTYSGRAEHGEKRVTSAYWLLSFSTGDRAGCSIRLRDDLLRKRKHRQRNHMRIYDYPKDKLQLVACVLKASTSTKANEPVYTYTCLLIDTLLECFRTVVGLVRISEVTWKHRRTIYETYAAHERKHGQGMGKKDGANAE